MNKDYYAILGVSKDASDDEIKKAYRKLAHKHHPDKQGGDEAKFKEINEAYQVLSDPQKRTQYNQFGSNFENAGAGGGFGGFDFSGFSSGGGFNFEGNLGDIFGDIFGGGGGFGQNKRNRGEDISIDVEITLEEAFTGIEKELYLYMAVGCDKCDGKGAESGSRLEKCSFCNGSGKINKERRTMFGVFMQAEVCSHCHGRGEKFDKHCNKCGGDGRVKDKKQIKIKIPAGIDNGQTIKLSGQGGVAHMPANNANLAGDLYIVTHIKPHAVFERKGDDILRNLEISFSKAVLGGVEQVDTLKGKIKLKIPAGIQVGKVIKVKGEGMPRLQSRGTGDLYVMISIKIPNKISRSQKKLIEELDREGL